MKRVIALASVMTITLALNACSDSSETSRVAAAPPVAHPRSRRLRRSRMTAAS